MNLKKGFQCASLLGLFVLVGSGISQSLEVMWKAQALVSMDKADSILNRKGKLTVAQRFEVMVHMAYGNIANPDIPFLRKTTDRVIVYHIAMGIGAKGEILDVAFVYDKNTHEFLGPRVDRLPPGWMLLPKEYDGNIMLVFDNYEDESSPALAFTSADPFLWHVIPPD